MVKRATRIFFIKSERWLVVVRELPAIFSKPYMAPVPTKKMVVETSNSSMVKPLCPRRRCDAGA